MHKSQLDITLKLVLKKNNVMMYLDFRKNTVPIRTHYHTTFYFAHKNTFTYLKKKRIESNLSAEQYSKSNTMSFPLSLKLCSFSKLHYRIN